MWFYIGLPDNSDVFFFLFSILFSAVLDIEKFLHRLFFLHIKFLYYLLSRQHFIFTFPDIGKISASYGTFFKDNKGVKNTRCYGIGNRFSWSAISNRFRGPQTATEFLVEYMSGPDINNRSRGPEISKSCISDANCEPQNLLFNWDRSGISVASFRTAKPIVNIQANHVFFCC